MKIAALVALAFGGASAFVKTPALPRATRQVNALRMSAIADVELEAGKTAPFPDGFDPLGLSKDKSFKELKKWREAELKHGRVAMLAVLGFIVQENFHPLWGFGEKNMEGAVYHFQEIQNVYPLFWTALIFIIGLFEARIIARVWDQDVGSTDIAGVREDAINGDLGWDPLRIVENQDTESFIQYRNRELNNGRLAMIAIAGLVVQEKFVTKGIPEFDFGRFNAPASAIQSLFTGFFN